MKLINLIYYKNYYSIWAKKTFSLMQPDYLGEQDHYYYNFNFFNKPANNKQVKFTN